MKENKWHRVGNHIWSDEWVKKLDDIEMKKKYDDFTKDCKCLICTKKLEYE